MYKCDHEPDRFGSEPSYLSVFIAGTVILAATCLSPSEASAARVEAFPGEPFGVAEITIPFPPEDVGQFVGASGFSVTEPSGRVLYPAFNQGFFKRLMGQNAPPPRTLTVLMLFRGTDPFEVTVRTPTPQTVSVVPRVRPPRVAARTIRKWWRYYNAFFDEQADLGDHPPIVGTYLTSMLARRLGMLAPLLDRLQKGDQPSEERRTLELLAGAQRLRLAALRANSHGLPEHSEPAELPVPGPIVWPQTTVVENAAGQEIEPIAMHVPEECFYVRYGNFTNYLWLNQLLEDYGGDIASMVSARGYQDSANQRIQQQLGLKQTLLAELLGPTVISDVAIIGRDTYIREGAAVGILFEARNALLGINLTAQRAEALSHQQNNGGVGETVRIADRDVSFFSTPDNRLRSFYAVDGNYHLVTTSRAIVKRFFEAGQGKSPLGASAEFHHARTTLPTSRDDTVFVFMSSAFFRGLLNPQYQIELSRRLSAVADIELIKMARWAARNEGKAGDTVDQLVASGVLPPSFGRRPDESGPIITDNRIIDSMRGARGTFMPIPDVPIRAVTRSEQTQCSTQAAHLIQNWRKMDPLLIAFKRYALDDRQLERVTIDAIISPLDEMKYGWLMSSLGAPTPSRVVPPAGNIISIEASLLGGGLFPSVPAHLLFAGVQDHVPLNDPRPTDLLKVRQILRSTPGFLGAWPKPGFLDMLPFQLGGTPDASGVSQLLFGVSRWQGRDFSVLSLDRGILDAAAQQLTIQDDSDLAQIRVHVGNLSQAKFAHWVRAMTYERTRQVSVGNARFLNLLTQQMGVPQAESLHVAEDLLDARLVCSLGGEYELAGPANSHLWQSTAWPESLNYAIPDRYESTLLTWFRGLNASLIKDSNQLVVRAHIDMQRKERQPTVNLPKFTLLGQSGETP